jgi:hypothetical protein
MQHDIQAQAKNAQEELQQAVAKLDAARAAYQDGPGARYAQALARQADLQRKSAAADAEVAAADAAFREAFEAAGYERTEAVRTAQRRKAEALELADATRAALERCAPDQQHQLIEASRLARQYIGAHQDAYAAYAQAQAREAIAQAGEQIARAMALMAHVPSSNRIREEFYGRDHKGLPSPHNDAGQLATSRAAVILDELAELAKARPEYARRPHVEMIGVCDLGALSARDLLTPAKVHMIRQRLTALH